MLPAPEACSPLPKHCIRAHSVRSIWKCIEAASAYVCQRTRTHPVWKLEERPSAFHCKLVTVTDSPCRFGYCTLRCAQLHSVLQSHLLAERVTVMEKGKKNKKKTLTNTNPQIPGVCFMAGMPPPNRVSASLQFRQRHYPVPFPKHSPKSRLLQGPYCWRMFSSCSAIHLATLAPAQVCMVCMFNLDFQLESQSRTLTCVCHFCINFLFCRRSVSLLYQGLLSRKHTRSALF